MYYTVMKNTVLKKKKGHSYYKVVLLQKEKRTILD